MPRHFEAARYCTVYSYCSDYCRVLVLVLVLYSDLSVLLVQYGTVLVTVPEYRTVGIPRTRTVLVRVLAFGYIRSILARIGGIR